MLEICAASSMTVSSWRTFSKTKQFWQFRRNESFLRILKDISWPKFPFCSESQLLTWLFNPWKNFSILLLLVTLVTLLKAVMLSLMFQISSRFFTCVWSRDLTSFYWNINHQTLAEKPVLVGSPHDDQKKYLDSHGPTSIKKQASKRLIHLHSVLGCVLWGKQLSSSQNR